MSRIQLPITDLTKAALPKKEKKAKKKTQSISQLKKLADSWFSKAVRLRDSELVNGEYLSECITCGKRDNWKSMQAGHFISRRVMALRYDEMNVNAQCVADNMFKQGDQYNYSVQLDLKYGDGTAKSLHDRRNDLHKFKREELEQIVKDSKSQVDFYLKQLDSK